MSHINIGVIGYGYWGPNIVRNFFGAENQVMNRPDMLAAGIALLIFYIGLSEKKSPWKFFTISFLASLLVDIHPISVYMISGFGMILFINNYRKFFYFAGGLISGILLVTALNYLFTGNYGIFGFFGNKTAYMNDHYFPVFTDPLNIIITRPVVKLKYMVVYLMGGLLFVFIAKYFRNLRTAIKENPAYRIIFLNAIIYLFVSNLFSEGGNGYNLYALIVYLPVFIILYNEILKSATGAWRSVFTGLLLLVPAVGLYKSLPRIKQWLANNSYFRAHYPDVRNLVKDGDHLLVRPSFSFALSSKSIHAEPVFPVLMYMHRNKQDFPNTILAKNLDIVMIDDMFLNDADKKTPVDKYSNGPFYQAVEEVKFDTSIIADMVSKGVFVPALEYQDFYHGHTVFYRVNKELLKKYCEEESIKKT